MQLVCRGLAGENGSRTSSNAVARERARRWKDFEARGNAKRKMATPGRWCAKRAADGRGGCGGGKGSGRAGFA